MFADVPCVQLPWTGHDFSHACVTCCQNIHEFTFHGRCVTFPTLVSHVTSVGGILFCYTACLHRGSLICKILWIQWGYNILHEEELIFMIRMVVHSYQYLY